MISTVYDFTPPHIVGALGDETLDPTFARAYERLMNKDGIEAVCLPFHVAKRNLKNVVACMRLMDITGMVVHPAHCNGIARWLGKTEKLARDIGSVDTIVRKGSQLVGMNAWARAIRMIAGPNKNRAILVAGSGKKPLAAMRTLARCRIKRTARLRSRDIENMPKDGLIIDFTDSKKRLRNMAKMSEIDTITRRIAIELLFGDKNH